MKYGDVGSPFVIQADDEECEDVMDTSVVGVLWCVCVCVCVIIIIENMFYAH